MGNGALRARGLERPCSGHGVLVLSGSCSQATCTQTAVFEQLGKPSFALDGIELARGDSDRRALVSQAVTHLKRGSDVLIRTRSASEEVEAVHRWAVSKGVDSAAVGLQISKALGTIAREIVGQCRPEGIVLAGGETSSIVWRMLGVKAVRVGENIVPGVPLCTSIDEPRLPFVLKSGNFGGREFFQQAVDAVKALPCASREMRIL